MAEAGTGRHLPVAGVPPSPGPLVSRGHLCGPSPGLPTRALGCAPPPGPTRPCFARDKDEGCESQRRAGAEQASTLAAPSAGPLTSLGGVAQGAAACQALIPPHLERCRSLAWGTWHTRQCSQPRMLPHQNLCMPAAEARSDASACCLNLCSRKEKL